MNPIISFEKFGFKYRAQKEPTLYDIDLNIYPGEKVLIVGPSGSGKSTLGHCINGLVPFAYNGTTTGKLVVDGKDPKKAGIFGLAKSVGTVLQDTNGQFIGLTVAEDIAFALENDCVPRDEMLTRVQAVTETVEITKLLRNAPYELSGGQKQRVSMAGVMIDEVPVLLFDEPLANLDPATGKKAIDLIDKIKKDNNTTVIIIEHRLEDVLFRDVDRIVVMDKGRILMDASPEEVLCSNILEEHGIRKPLYLSALKYAGVQVTTDMLPQHIETIKLEDCKTEVNRFFRSVERSTQTKSSETVLEVRNLNFSYIEGVPVLKDINFKINRGEMVSLVGRNGAGKSTLSGLICGFNAPTGGEILLDGEDITPLSIKERGERIGLVMQNPHQMISKPMIFDEVALGLKVRDVPEDEIIERVNETLKICGLYKFRNWPISALSFGQKKRVTIASILVINPEILILDEPTAGQDYKHYTEIMEFLSRIHRATGVTIIMITHDMHLMLEYTDRSLVVAEGELLADMTPAEVLTNEELCDKAYLKKTSLYDLAVKCGIDSPSDFVDCFIEYERQQGEEELKDE